jgi:hypothetical protein
MQRVSAYLFILYTVAVCVRIPHAAGGGVLPMGPFRLFSYVCVRILLYMCPHPAVYFSILLYVSPYFSTCVLILLHMCPHTAIYAS